MARAYYSRRDLYSRLDRTICLYDGYPYFIRVGPEPTGNLVSLYDMVTNKLIKNVDYTSDSFVVNSLTLGYVNIDNCAHYVSRVPSRRVNEAICVNNVHANRVYISDYVLTKEFKDMLLDKYPSKNEALRNVLEKKGRSTAFHKDFCFRSSIGSLAIEIFHKDISIGTVDKNGQITLYESNGATFWQILLRELGFM